MVSTKALRALGVAGLLLAGAALGQEATPAGQAAAQTSDRRLSELFYQLQVLQQEVQDLRGLVEEQSHQLNRLARDQKEQYIDLDRRVAELTTGGSGAMTRPSAAQAGSGSGNTSSFGTSSTTPAPSGAGAAMAGTSAAVSSLPASADEREAYQTAFDLMKARQFDQSIAAFNRLIVDYPNGQYTPNAYYWLGELYLANQNLEQARQSFMQVINLYPDHPKVPDTLYKLGVAYHRLGDSNKAMEYFNQVRTQYPQSSAAGLAASYQQELR
jgi:tol-pal system protein YbgF